MSEANFRRLWCKVAAVRERTTFAFTQDNELVYLAKGDVEAGKGDILSFVPTPPNSSSLRFGGAAVKWFGAKPYVLARGINLGPVTRATDNANPCAWKKRTESSADYRARQEAAGS